MNDNLKLILTESAVTIPQAIENLEQLKTELVPILEKYSNIVVTEGYLISAKNDKARLNKFKEAIEKRRKEVKSQVMSIYEPLAEQCKQLTAMIDEPIEVIDRQLKEFDEKRIQEKYNRLTVYFATKNKFDFVTLDDIINPTRIAKPKWMNKTEKVESIENEIERKLNQIGKDYDALRQQYGNSEFWIPLDNKFRECRELSPCLVYATQLEHRKQQEKVTQRENVENAFKIDSNEGNIITLPEQQTAVTAQSEQRENTQMLTGTFKVECTRENLIALRNFMKAHNIKFEVVKN